MLFHGCCFFTNASHVWASPWSAAGIRQLQLMLLKMALLLGIEIHVNVEFKGLIEPPEDQEGESKPLEMMTCYFICMALLNHSYCLKGI